MSSKGPWAEHFASPADQVHAAQFGMWVFIASEILLFGGLFVCYGYYRIAWGEAFRQGVAGENIWLGGAMTAVLLTASLFVAQAQHSARRGKSQAAGFYLVLAILFAIGFLLIHLFEYESHAIKGELPGIWYTSREITTRGIAIFYALWWLMTGLHVVHVCVGIGLLAVIAARAFRGHYTEEYHVPVEVSGMYWHLVDTIWMFLFPLFYCAR